RLACSHEAFPLADGELMDPFMPADNLTVLRHDFARGTRGLTPLPRVLFDEIRIRSALDETDLLRLRLFRCWQSGAPRDFANFRLRQFAQREYGLRQLVLIEAEQEVGLILFPILSSQQEPAAQCLVELHARVMAGSHAIGSDPRGVFDEVMKLDVVVAQNARTRRFAPEIRVDERRDDGLFEILLEIKDVIRNAQLRRDTTRVPEIVERAASAV